MVIGGYLRLASLFISTSKGGERDKGEGKGETGVTETIIVFDERVQTVWMLRWREGREGKKKDGMGVKRKKDGRREGRIKRVK